MPFFKKTVFIDVRGAPKSQASSEASRGLTKLQIADSQVKEHVPNAEGPGK